MASQADAVAHDEAGVHVGDRFVVGAGGAPACDQVARLARLAGDEKREVALGAV